MDVLPDRNLENLIPYFKEIPYTQDLEFLVIDMNAAYYQLIPKVFNNAQLVIDRFHIVKPINKTFDDFIILEVKRLVQMGGQSTTRGRKIKSNWKRLLKDRQNIDTSEYKTWRSFRSSKYPYLTEAMVIDHLLSYSEPLKEAYNVFHDITDTFREKDPDLFFDTIRTMFDKLNPEFRQSIQNLENLEEGIRNTLIHLYCNGKIEAKIYTSKH